MNTITVETVRTYAIELKEHFGRHMRPIGHGYVVRDDAGDVVAGGMGDTAREAHDKAMNAICRLCKVRVSLN